MVAFRLIVLKITTIERNIFYAVKFYLPIILIHPKIGIVIYDKIAARKTAHIYHLQTTCKRPTIRIETYRLLIVDKMGIGGVYVAAALEIKHCGLVKTAASVRTTRKAWSAAYPDGALGVLYRGTVPQLHFTLILRVLHLVAGGAEDADATPETARTSGGKNTTVFYDKFATGLDDDVLDPFMVAGTTAVVARELGRNYIGIELNSEYVRLAGERLG